MTKLLAASTLGAVALGIVSGSSAPAAARGELARYASSARASSQAADRFTTAALRALGKALAANDSNVALVQSVEAESAAADLRELARKLATSRVPSGTREPHSALVGRRKP